MIRFAGLLLVLLLVSERAWADCAPEDRDMLMRQQYSQEQIDAICNLREEDLPAPAGAVAAYCETEGGFCLLAEPAPAGRDCTCSTQHGPVRGVTE